MTSRMHKTPLVNYIGQLRIYSLIDLVLMLFAVRAGKYDIAGAVFLHIAFLAYLEWNHKHSYRKVIPSLIWVVLAILGILFFRHVEVMGYLIFSYLYTLKNNKKFGPYASLFRGIQSFFIVSALIGYTFLTFAVLILMALRNFAGDMRDVEKDRKEKMNTLPIVLGMKKSVSGIHLIALMITSAVWFSFLNIEWYWLILVFIIQILSYNLTAR